MFSAMERDMSKFVNGRQTTANMMKICQQKKIQRERERERERETV